MRDRGGQQPFRGKREQVEAGTVGRAILGKRHVLGDPQKVSRGGRQPERKAGGGGEMGLARRGNFMQRAARQAAAEHGVERLDAERHNSLRRAGGQPGGFLQSPQALAQFLDH